MKTLMFKTSKNAVRLIRADKVVTATLYRRKENNDWTEESLDDGSLNQDLYGLELTLENGLTVRTYGDKEELVEQIVSLGFANRNDLSSLV